MQRRDKLNQELSRRLDALREPPHSQSECFAPSRPILREALIWVAFAIIVWVTAVNLL
jgi:hypothetical protein